MTIPNARPQTEVVRSQIFRTRGSTVVGGLFSIVAIVTLPGLAGANGLLERSEYGVVFLLLLTLVARAFRIGIAQTDNEIKLRTLQWTYTYRRQDVRRFIVLQRPLRFRPSASISLLAIELSDGENRIFWPFGRGGPVTGHPDEVSGIAEVLNRAWGIRG